MSKEPGDAGEESEQEPEPGPDVSPDPHGPEPDPPAEPWRPPDGPSPLRTGPVLRHGDSSTRSKSPTRWKTDELIEAFKELTLIELSEFVKQFEETFEVTAAAPIAVTAVPAPDEETGGAAEHKVEVDVVLESVGERKIQVIKEVRALTSLGLKEAKDLVDGAPRVVLEKVSRDIAASAKARLEGAGAEVTVE